VGFDPRVTIHPPPVRRRPLGVAFVLVFVLASACSADPPPPSANTTPVPVRGGTLRIVMPRIEEGFIEKLLDPAGDRATLDPTLDGLSRYSSWEVLRCCLARALLSNNGRATDEGGARIHPDLADSQPDISPDRLSWTFHVRRGLHYAPPMADVEITAPDLVRGFHRLLSPVFGGGFAYLYSDVVGVDAFAAGEAASITGLETPDSHTLVVRLTQRAGDLAPRLALPWAVPIPPSPRDQHAPFGVADGHDDGYGRFLVSSGPYMIEGADALDLALPPADQRALSGLVPGQRLALVRNPSWSADGDPLRAATPDRIEFHVVPTMDDAVTAILAGNADLLLNDSFPNIPADAIDRLTSNPAQARLIVNPSDLITQILMNTAQPPFDDLHVRRAANYAINKARVVELAGGSFMVRPAHHLVPDAMEDNLLSDYRPYDTPGNAGDLQAAKAEMAQSRYDTDRDGVCDASECDEVLVLARAAPFPPIAEAVRDDLAQIGIGLELDARGNEEFFNVFFDPANHYGMFAPLAWAKDSLSPAGFFVGQFYGPAALAGSGNGHLVGATTAQLSEWGYGDIEVPNVDRRIDDCLALTGSAQFECWAGLDQYMMANVVPSVPFGLGVGVVAASPAVTGFVWDQLAAAPAFDQISLAH
jgi:peptide/nickel transport system substrate-binding protein